MHCNRRPLAAHRPPPEPIRAPTSLHGCSLALWHEQRRYLRGPYSRGGLSRGAAPLVAEVLCEKRLEASPARDARLRHTNLTNHI